MKTQSRGMLHVPNPAAAKGASRTRDSMRQPIVGEDQRWAQDTNLFRSVQGTDGRVMPAASQMNKAAGFNPTQVAVRAKAVASGAAPVAKRFAGMDPVKARSARLEAFQQRMSKFQQGKPTPNSVRVGIDAQGMQQAAAPAANQALVRAAGIPRAQLNASVRAAPRFANRNVLAQQPGPATPNTLRANVIRTQHPQAVPQAPVVQAPPTAAQRAQSAAAAQAASQPHGLMQYTPNPSPSAPLGSGSVRPTNWTPGAAEAARAAKGKSKRAAQENTMAMIDTSGPDAKLVFEKKASQNTALGGKYPLDSYADIKAAVDFFQQSWTEFDPVERHIFSVKTAAAAREIGLEVPEMMARYGSLEYADDVEAHIANRKAGLEKNAHGIYDALLEKQAELHPEEFADLLTKADIATGLNWHWGGPVADPYFATFGGQPEPVIFKVANGEISEEQLHEIAANGSLDGVFDKELVDGFKKDPVTIFASLPDDAKQIITNFAVA